MLEDRDSLRFLVFTISTLAHSVMASCDRLRTATGIFKGKRLRGVGYNGSLPGHKHCDEAGHLLIDSHCLRTRHGEKNALSNTPEQFKQGGEAIVLGTPCITCVQDLIHEGIKTIHYVGEYQNARGKEEIQSIANQAGVSLVQHNIDWQEHLQTLCDLLTRKGGILWLAGYRLKITKESLQPPEERKEQ